MYVCVWVFLFRTACSAGPFGAAGLSQQWCAVKLAQGCPTCVVYNVQHGSDCLAQSPTATPDAFPEI